MGFAKLDRETAKKIFKDVLAHRIYSLIVMNATHAEYEYNGILLKPGQWVRSYSKLVDDLEYIDGRGFKKPNKSTISRAIDRLVDANIIEIEYPIIIANHATDSATVRATDNATINATLFTLLETQSYQGFEVNEEVNHATDSATVHATDNATDSASKTRINKQELNKKNNTRKRAKRIYEVDSDEMVLVNFFISEIRKNDPKFKEPNKQTWADDFRKLIELDKRDKSEISKLIRWVQQDAFWKSNILSPRKLREKYSALVIKMNDEQSNVALETTPIAKNMLVEINFSEE